MGRANEVLTEESQPEEVEFITASEAARIAGVANETMCIWLRSGRIPGFQSGKKGTWRISKQKLMRLLLGEE